MVRLESLKHVPGSQLEVFRTDARIMKSKKVQFLPPSFDRQIITIVGGFGSGKSEVSVNLARFFASSQELPVTIADLDIINPYFRSREAAGELEALGIRSLLPPGEQVHADLPIIIPEIKGAIQSNKGILILDVGGDDMGARLLGSLQDAFVPGTFELLLVLNRNRPFTSTIEGTRKTIRDIEEASSLKFTGIISNTHMMQETTAGMVHEGYEFSEEISRVTGLPVKLVTAEGIIAEQLDPTAINVPMLRLDRSLLKPWERRESSGQDVS